MTLPSAPLAADTCCGPELAGSWGSTCSPPSTARLANPPRVCAPKPPWNTGVVPTATLTCRRAAGGINHGIGDIGEVAAFTCGLPSSSSDSGDPGAAAVTPGEAWLPALREMDAAAGGSSAGSAVSSGGNATGDGCCWLSAMSWDLGVSGIGDGLLRRRTGWSGTWKECDAVVMRRLRAAKMGDPRTSLGTDALPLSCSSQGGKTGAGWMARGRGAHAESCASGTPSSALGGDPGSVDGVGDRTGVEEALNRSNGAQADGCSSGTPSIGVGGGDGDGVGDSDLGAAGVERMADWRHSGTPAMGV